MNKFAKLFFHNLTPYQIIAKNSFWLTSGKILGGVLRALLVISSARILGPEHYGNFALAINFVLIFSFLPEFGLTAILTRELSKEKYDKQKIFNCIFSLSLLFSLISYLLIFIVGYIVIRNPISFQLLPILGLMMIIDILREMIYSIYRAELRGELQGILHFITNFFLFSIGILALLKFPSEFYLAWAYFFAISLGFLISSVFAINYLKKFKFVIDKNLYKFYFNSSWPIALGNTLFLLILFTDTIILSWFHPSYIIGLYNSAVKINEFLVLIPTGVALAILPMFSKNINQKENLASQISFSIYLNYLITLPIIFGIFILSDKITVFIFGKDYLNAHIGLKILIPSLLASSLFMIYSQFLIAIDKRKELLIYEFIAFFVNLTLNLLFIPKYGILAAAFNTTLSNYLALFFAHFNIRKYLDINLLNNFHKPFITSIIMGFFLILLKPLNLILVVLIGIIFYFLSLVLFKDELTIKLLRKLF